MSTNSNLPPLSSDGVFSVSGSMIIDAPRDKVWSILISESSNLCRESLNPVIGGHIDVENRQSLRSLDDQPLTDEYPPMSPANIPPTKDDSSLPPSSFQCTVLEHWSCTLGPIRVNLPQWLLSSCRWQALSAVEGGKTKYESMFVFTGLLSYLLKFVLQSWLRGVCQAMGEGLRRRSEES